MPDDSRSDEMLVDAVNRDDVSAFEALYRRHRDWVVRLAMRFTHSHDDALDVLQETFSYLLGKFPGFKLTARLTTFLYPVVRNLSVSVLRKRGRYVSDEGLLSEVADARDGEGRTSRDELTTVLGNLPEGQREVVLMRFVDEMTTNEIAEALGIPSGTVKSRLHHALRVLREDERTRSYFLG